MGVGEGDGEGFGGGWGGLVNLLWACRDVLGFEDRWRH